MSIVEVQVGYEPASALGRRSIREPVSPFAQQSLDEPFSLPVRSRGIWPDSDVTQAVLLADRSKGLRFEDPGVVGHHALSNHTMIPKPLHGALEEASGILFALILKHLDVRGAAVVIDTDEDELPAGAFGVPPDPGDAMANSV